jgi:hypothetical protein
MSADPQPALDAAVDAIAQRVIDRIGVPKDEWEVAAQLEVLGLRDADARALYGKRDLFDLARAIHAQFHAGAYSFVVEGEDPRPYVHPAIAFLRRYASGLLFSAPMALQAATILIWGYGIWGAIDLDLTKGSAIALAFIASYIVAGGFSQAIVRRGLFYIYQQEEVLARWVALRGWWVAARVMLALIVPALLLNALFDILPWSMVFTSIAYYVALAILWLNWSLIYLVRKTHLFLTITAIALAAVLVAAKIFHAPPLLANAIGLFVADSLSFAVAVYALNAMVKRPDVAQPVNPPRLTVLVFSTSRFFVYGLLYNTYLFADRVIAWTTPVGREDFPPYGFWLSVRYELAMDLALVVIVVMSGFVEYSIERFSEDLIPSEKKTKSVDAAEFLRHQMRIDRRRSLQLGIAAIVAVAIAYGVSVALRLLPNPRLQEALAAPTTVPIFLCAAAGYVFLMFALRNILLLLTLSRVDVAVRCVAIALAVNVSIGFVCSRAIHYAGAVAGVLFGSMVMAWLASRAAKRVLARLDYYYYAAY